MTIVVCGLGDVPAMIRTRRPSHMITLLDPASMIETPSGIAAERHLKLGVNDIAEATEGLVLPGEALVRQLLEFGRGWDETSPLLIHCWAGISRSTASAFVLACERNADVDEMEIAASMRRAARHASPNRRIVALADDLLGRGGRMVDAVDAMGDYDHAMAGPFDFGVRY
jgi:predicted protein tyrosine phosphatase